MSLVSNTQLLATRIGEEFVKVRDEASAIASARYTKSEVDAAIAAAVAGVVDGAPGALDTLNELAAALGDSANFAATVTNALALKAATADVNAALDLKADKNGVYTIAQANAAIAAATTGVALRDKVLNLQAPVNPSTTAVINPAIAGIGNVNGFVVNLSFGNFDEAGPILIDNKWQLNIEGPPAATTTAVTIKNGLTIQNSNGVRITRVQFEGNSSISSRAGTGLHFQTVQLMGNVTLGGTGGFMMFTDCEFGGDVTISPSFAGTVYFIRCSFGKPNGVYTFSQTSPLQAIVMDSSGIPNAGFGKASYSGMMTYKNGSQALFINGVAVSTAGATSGQVLKFNGTAFVPAADSTADVTKAYVDGAVGTLNTAIATKANSADVYTKSATDVAISTAINNLAGAAPGTLDTLAEIAAAIQADQTAGAALAQQVAQKANAADVYTKSQADAQIANAASGLLSTSGGAINGSFVVSGIEGVDPLFEVNPTIGTMYYVPTDGSGSNFEAGPGFVSVVGSDNSSVMVSEGIVSMMSNRTSQTPAVPTEPYHAATKAYVDDAIAGIETGGGGDTGDITFNGGTLLGTEGQVRLSTQNLTTTGNYALAEGVDYSTAVWENDGITFNDPTQSVYDTLWALGGQFDIVVLEVNGTPVTVTTTGSSTPGLPQPATMFVNETAVGGPLNVTSVQATIRSGTESYVEINETDFRVDVQDDIRIYGNDTFRLVNRSPSRSITIETNDNDFVWEFNSDGHLILPQGGDIKDEDGNSVLGGVLIDDETASSTSVYSSSKIEGMVSGKANAADLGDVSANFVATFEAALA